MVGGVGRDLLYGGAGNDRVSGHGDDTMYGGDGNDQLTNILDVAGNSRLDGDAGDDTLQGGIGNDFLIGDAGDDTLRGGEGNDRLDGNDGNDLIYAGTGVDRFTFTTNWQRDTIADYEEGENLDVRGVAISGLTFEIEGADMVITQTGTSNEIVLTGGATLDTVTVNRSTLVVGEDILI